MIITSIYQVQIDDDNANDADHQDDHHQTKEVKGDAYTEGRRVRAVGHSARHRFLIIIYIIYNRPDRGLGIKIITQMPIAISWPNLMKQVNQV